MPTWPIMNRYLGEGFSKKISLSLSFSTKKRGSEKERDLWRQNKIYAALCFHAEVVSRDRVETTTQNKGKNYFFLRSLPLSFYIFWEKVFLAVTVTNPTRTWQRIFKSIPLNIPGTRLSGKYGTRSLFHCNIPFPSTITHSILSFLLYLYRLLFFSNSQLAPFPKYDIEMASCLPHWGRYYWTAREEVEIKITTVTYIQKGEGWHRIQGCQRIKILKFQFAGNRFRKISANYFSSEG